MNKVAAFFLAPVTVFFLPRVYRDTARSSGLRGVLYIAYSSFLVATLVLAIFLNRAATSDDFIRWFTKEMPVVLWTPQGLSLENGQKTAVLTHPTYGPVAIFDMDRTAMEEKDMGRLYFFLTSKKIFFRMITGALDERDVTKTTFQSGKPLPTQVRINGELIENFYQKGKRVFLFATPAVVFLSSFIALLIFSLIYSAVGLLLNLMRTHRLHYGAIFSLACLIPGIALALLGFAIFFPLPAFIAPMSFLIGLIYMFAAFTLTDKSTP